MAIIQSIIRSDVLAMTSYAVSDATGLLKLDAMENPFGLPQPLAAELGRRLAAVALNRYPEQHPRALLDKLRQVMQVPDGCEILLGNGSDELISMITVACAKPGAAILAPVPGFVMYQISTALANLEFTGVPLTADLQLDMPAMLSAIASRRPAVIYLAYPNNPTGALFDVAAMERIIVAAPNSLIVIDEAYQPFAGHSWMPRAAEFPNLVVMRTVSKLGLAGIRLGYLAGRQEWIAEFDKVRPPYNINVLTQATAVFLLDHVTVLDAQAALLRAEREQLRAALAGLPGVTVFPSAANFLLVRVSDAAKIFDALLEARILVKNVSKMHVLLTNCLRITVGAPHENAQLLAALQLALT
jgi:histidinol-phosphate aminotransferase